MKKTTSLIIFIACISLILGSCSKSMSYSDYVKREKNRIKDFMAERDIVVLKDYPSDGVFKSNEFYLDPTGIYINVVDSGNGTRAQAGAQVYFRFSGVTPLPVDSTVIFNLSDNSPVPFDITYGLTTTYTSSNTQNWTYTYQSPGLVTPLKYVGEGAVVRLIIPFRDDQGSSYQTSYYVTYYYNRVTYSTIINDAK